MKLSDLIEMLQEAQVECGDDDPEITLAINKDYPMEYSIGGVRVVEDEEGNKKPLLVDRDQVGYGQREWWLEQ